MFASTEKFWVLLAFSLVVGAMLGVFYDAIRLVINTLFPVKASLSSARIPLGGAEKEAERALFPIDKRITPRDIAYFFADIVFFAVSACAVIILIFHLNYGEIRAFSLISALAGFTVYRKTLGRPTYFLLEKALFFLKTAIKKILKLLLYPILKPLKRLIGAIVNKMSGRAARRKALRVIEIMEKSEMQRREKRKNTNERDQG